MSNGLPDDSTEQLNVKLAQALGLDIVNLADFTLNVRAGHSPLVVARYFARDVPEFHQVKFKLVPVDPDQAG